MFEGLLPSPVILFGFLGASFVLAVTPGPGVLYIVARSLFQGKAQGMASVVGVAAGNLVNAIGASLGLAALFSVSALAFGVVKWAGAAYLVYLGISTILARDTVPKAAHPEPGQPRKIARQGFVVALLNPKTTIFFAAFLPQFISGEANVALQSSVLAVIFVAIAIVTDTAYVLAASRFSGFVSGSGLFRRASRFVSGGVFVGLGVATALSDGRSAR